MNFKILALPLELLKTSIRCLHHKALSRRGASVTKPVHASVIAAVTVHETVHSNNPGISVKDAYTEAFFLLFGNR